MNTYNYYLTEAEKTDIAGSNLSVDRLAEGADVSDYKFKERSNAFYIDADNIEVFNCSILSSQDTLGRMVQQIMDITHISTVVQSVVSRLYLW